MGGLIGTSRVLWGLDFKDKLWAAMGNSFDFLEPSKNDLATRSTVGEEEVTLSGVDQYSYPQIRDQPQSQYTGSKSWVRILDPLGHGIDSVSLVL